MKTNSKQHIFYCILFLLSLGCLITAFATFDYNFAADFVSSFKANILAYSFAAAWLIMILVVVVAEICLRVKNNEETRGEVALGFQITAVIVLEVALCAPIFIIWIIEKIHDAISDRKREIV